MESLFPDTLSPPARGRPEVRHRATALHMLRHGFSHTKQQAAWEAEVMDPQSKLVLAHEQGKRDEALIRRLYEDTVQRVANRHDLVLFTDGEQSYASLFPEFFGVAHQPSRNGTKGRRPKMRHRIPRSLAHVQIVKRREGARVVEVDVRYTHGSRRRAGQALDALGYTQPNTSAIERRNGTARRMSIYQVRKSIAFSRRPDAKLAPAQAGAGGVSPSTTGVANIARCDCLWRSPWTKKVPTVLSGHGGRSRRSHSLNPGTPAFTSLSSRTPEIISHDYPGLQTDRKRKNRPCRSGDIARQLSHKPHIL